MLGTDRCPLISSSAFCRSAPSSINELADVRGDMLGYAQREMGYIPTWSISMT